MRRIALPWNLFPIALTSQFCRLGRISPSQHSRGCNSAMEEQCAKQFENGREKEQLMSYIVVLFAVLTRFIPHMPNFSPVFGALLFGGAHLKPRDAIWYPLALLSASDVVLTTVVYGMRMRIGWGQAVTWVGFAVVALIGYWLRNRETLRNIGIAALAGPTAFFLGRISACGLTRTARTCIPLLGMA
jgi:hypothetical protein